MADVAGAFRRIKWMGQPARGMVEVEATRMRDEPGLGQGGEGTVRPRPYWGVSGEAEKEQYVRGPTGGSWMRRRTSGWALLLLLRLQGPGLDLPRRFVLGVGVR